MRQRHCTGVGDLPLIPGLGMLELPGAARTCCHWSPSVSQPAGALFGDHTALLWQLFTSSARTAAGCSCEWQSC